MLWKGVVMYMDILKTVCTIGAVTIFYFSPIPLVVTGVVWCVQICLRALKSNFAPKRNVFLLADIAMPFVITSAWIIIGMLLSSIFDQRKSLSNLVELFVISACWGGTFVVRLILAISGSKSYVRFVWCLNAVVVVMCILIGVFMPTLPE